MKIDEIRDVVPAVPETGFVRAYFEEAIQRTGAAALSHLGVALSVLASSCPTTYSGWYGGVEMYANIFTLVVGAAGDGVKSTPVSLGEAMLKAALPGRVAVPPQNEEALREGLSDNPVQTWFMDEFGNFLGHTKRDYAAPLRTSLLRLFDGKDLTAAKAAKKRVEAPVTRMSLAAAGAVPLLEQHLEPADWMGGLMSRWLILYSQPDVNRLDSYPPPRGPIPPHLIQMLHERAEPNLRDGFSAQCVGFDPDARALWDAWFKAHMGREDLPGYIAGIKLRTTTIAFKIAMLYAWDYGYGRHGGPFVITMRELVPALRLIELHVRSVCILGEQLVPHDYARKRKHVLELFPYVGCTRDHPYLLRETKYRPRDLQEVLDGLVAEYALARIQVIGQPPCYQRTHGATGPATPDESTPEPQG